MRKRISEPYLEEIERIESAIAAEVVFPFPPSLRNEKTFNMSDLVTFQASHFRILVWVFQEFQFKQPHKYKMVSYS